MAKHSTYTIGYVIDTSGSVRQPKFASVTQISVKVFKYKITHKVATGSLSIEKTPCRITVIQVTTCHSPEEYDFL